MKKILTLALASTMFFSANAQDAADKKVMAGLTFGGALNFNKPQTNTIDANVGGDFVAGMALDWNFSNNIGLATGLEFDFNRFRTTYNKDIFFDYRDKNVIQAKDEPNNAETSFMLNERKHKSIYLTIPVMLKFQTNFMGYMRYYGKFGVRNSFLLTTRTNNEGQGFNELGAIDKEITQLDDMISPGVMSFYKGSIGLSGGAEYNITGSTVLVAELGFYYGFSEVFQQEGALFGDDDKSLSLFQREEDGTRGAYYSPSLKQSQLLLKVAVLF
ncbi:outer membrane beta-barrel protein [Brumimicrobium salinarum]|nr:outer membrane beta-barrel protein [Brumimicrobium salinarum]